METIVGRAACSPADEYSNRHLKRVNSSLFSIATVAEDCNELDRNGLTKDDSFTAGKLDKLSINDKSGSFLLPHDNRTGLIFESSTDHYDIYNRLHKERPLRVESTRTYILEESKHDLRKRCVLLPDVSSRDGSGSDYERVGDKVKMKRKLRLLDEDDYHLVHRPGYIQRLSALSESKNGDKNDGRMTERLDDEASQYASVYLRPDSFKSAKCAVEALCSLVKRVVVVHSSDEDVEGKIGNDRTIGDGCDRDCDQLDNGFAIVRPPGHHAGPSMAGGYCILNTVALAALYARYRLGVRRVMVVDWDVHHGDGTQDALLNDPSVLYFSVHRHDGGNFFPFTSSSSMRDDGTRRKRSGSSSVVGEGAGLGRNVNVAWSRKFMGDDEYRAVWSAVLHPIAGEFNPDLVLVSAGFDAALGDMGECNVTPECFGDLTKELMGYAEGKIVCALEGGYVRSVLHKCVERVICALLEGKRVDRKKKGSSKAKEGLCSSSDSKKRSPNSNSGSKKNSSELQDILEQIEPSAASSIQDTITFHRPYWKCFQNGNEGIDNDEDEIAKMLPVICTECKE